MKKRKGIPLILSCLLLILSMTACSGESNKDNETNSTSDPAPITTKPTTSLTITNTSVTNDNALNVRNIYAKSDGQKFHPVAFIADYSKAKAEGKDAIDIAREMAKGLPEIEITDDFEIVTEGKMYDGPFYSLIPEDCNETHYANYDNKFKGIPTGKYILHVSVTWEDENGRESIVYFFKITIINGYARITNYIGKVAIISSGQEYAPLENLIYANKYGLSADGLRKQPQDVNTELKAIPITEDLEITIEGEYICGVAYTLFNAEFEKLYYRQPEYTEPEVPGEYILEIVVDWGNKIQNGGYQYFFKIEK